MSSTNDVPPDVNKGPQILIACGICVAVALGMVILRLFVRLKILRNIGWDDYFIAAAMVWNAVSNASGQASKADQIRRSCLQR